jgi:hypothetical protein
MLGQSLWRVRMPKAPTCATDVTLGCRSNPKFHLLEDLGEGLRALLVKYLTLLTLKLRVSNFSPSFMGCCALYTHTHGVTSQEGW